MKLGTAGVIGRFKPLNNSGALMLEAVCAQADNVIIGIGSANKYNAHNPFTAQESEEMVRAFLGERFHNYEVLHVPDFAHIHENRDGHAWKEYVVLRFGMLDHFVTGNPSVAKLLQDKYAIVHPDLLVPKEKHEKHSRICSTHARMLMAAGGDWKALVPAAVVQYLEQHQLVERFCSEFGPETITKHTGTDYMQGKSLEDEHMHAKENNAD